MIALLNGHSLTVKDRFQPEKLSIQLSERQSTANMTLGPEAPVLSVDDWVKVESGPGSGIIWRVRIIDEQFDKKTRTVSLEHAIQTLRDRLMFGDVDTKAISGGSTATARQAVQYILRQQSDWTLGDIEYNVSNPYSFNGDDLFSALETVSGSLDDAIWEYDFSVHPFKLYIRKMDSTLHSEMRMDRNIRTLKKTIDRSRMYTRHYPIGKNNLKIDGGYVSKNEDLYGTVSKTETDQSLDTKEKLKAWALERLNKHCEPSVTVSISGLELAAATGEELDSFTIGKMCRVPLPEFNTTITERVTKLSYGDVTRDPTSVTITLANELQDVATILKQQSAGGGRGGRAAAKQAEEDHAWFVDTTEHVGMVAEAVAGEGADKDWSRVASVMVDGEGIHQRVVKTEGDIVTAFTAIEATDEAITLEAKRAKTQEGELSALIKVEAGRITQEVTDRKSADTSLSGRITVEAGRITQEVTDRTNADTALDGRITVEAGKISQIVSAVGEDGEVTAASIVLAINESGESEARIDAQKVYIGNQKSTTVIAGKCTLNEVTADYISGKIAALARINMSDCYCSRLTVTQDLYYANGLSYKNGVWFLTLENSGGVVTLKSTNLNGDETIVGTFDHAAPTTLSGSWSGNKFTVTASPQGNKVSEIVYARPVSSQGAAYTDIYTATTNGSNWTNHGDATRLTLSATGRIVQLKDSSNIIYAQLTIPAAEVSGTWSGSTWTATSTLGGSASVTLSVNPVSSQGGAYSDIYVATSAQSGYVNHGNAKRLYLVRNGMTVSLKDANSTSSGTIYAQLTVPNPTVTLTGEWEGATLKHTAKIGSTTVATNNVTMTVNPVSSQGGNYTDVYVATYSGGFVNHGNARRLTMSLNGNTVQLKTPEGSILAQLAVGPTNVSVAFDCTDGGNPSTDYNDKPITAKAMQGTTQLATADQIIHMTQGAWSSGKKAVNVRMTNDSGKLITRQWISIPYMSESCTNPAQNVFKIKASCGGSSVTYTLRVSSTGGLASFTRD